MKIDFSINEEELKDLKEKTKEVVELLKEGVKKTCVDADIFVGGSFAKGTLGKSEEYDPENRKFSGSQPREGGHDIDIFVRFDWKYENLEDYLDKIIKVAGKNGWKVDMIHGSRDYFRLYKDKKIVFEIIPVLRIRKPREARNVTDLSYFHVNYVKRNLRKKMKEEVLMAKKFCKANGIYGAESYINGFSGYGLECLIINYGKFEKMLRELVKVKERIILDPAKLHGKKEDVLFELNEGKLHSPIILIDPTWKERNVLAALNMGAFRKFQEQAKKYLKNPSARHFEIKEFDASKLEKKAKQKKAEFVHLVLETDKQEGDIAGTKMKKFVRFLERELERYFEVLDGEFVYDLGQRADAYFILKSKREIVRIGPSLKMKEDVSRFRKKNKKTFVKNGLLHARIKVDFTGKEFLRKFDKWKMKEMGITEMRII